MSNLIQNRKNLEKEEFIRQYIEIYDKRVYLIAKHVVLSQISLLILTGIITILISLIGFTAARLLSLLVFWMIFEFIIPVFSIIYIYFKRNTFYYNFSWRQILLYYLIIWLSITTYIGIFVDFYLGFGKTLLTGLCLSLYYIIGYLIAKKCWSIRFYFNKKQIKYLFRIISIVLIIGFLILGWYILNLSIKGNNIKGIPENVDESFLSEFIFTIGLFTMLNGFGIVLSAYLNFRMLYLLYAEPFWNVKSDSPNKLYMKCLSRTMICMFFFWLFMEIFFPPISINLDKLKWERTKKITPKFSPKERSLVYNEWKEEGLAINVEKIKRGYKY